MLGRWRKLIIKIRNVVAPLILNANDLAKALSYSNPALLERYRRDYPNNQLSAEEALRELIKYLWLCEKHRQDCAAFPDNTALHFPCSMYPEMAEIDDMWHTFLLFTKAYQDFCHTYLGRFVHHLPKTPSDHITPEVFELELTRYLFYVYDCLGEETVKKWFKEE